jgi:hypothetical protein
MEKDESSETKRLFIFQFGAMMLYGNGTLITLNGKQAHAIPATKAACLFNR